MRSLAALAAVALTVACSRQSPPPPATTQPPPPAATPAPAAAEPRARSEPVGATFHRVNMQIVDGVVAEIANLDGAFVSTHAGQPPFLDDPRSFNVRIDRGQFAMSAESLTTLLNNYVFAYDGAPLKNLKAAIESGRMKLSGTMHKGVDVPFTIVADVSLADDGRIRLHPTSVKTIGIPTGGLMKMFGIELEELIKVDKAPGVEIVDNDFLLRPDRILPAPKIMGRLTAVAVVGDRLVQRFGPEQSGKSDGNSNENYLHFRGGTLRFGRLTMSDTDMRLIDTHPSDAFEFSLPHYQSALAKGSAKVLPSGALRVFMPDYSK